MCQDSIVAETSSYRAIMTISLTEVTHLNWLGNSVLVEVIFLLTLTQICANLKGTCLLKEQNSREWKLCPCKLKPDIRSLIRFDIFQKMRQIQERGCCQHQIICICKRRGLFQKMWIAEGDVHDLIRRIELRRGCYFVVKKVPGKPNIAADGPDNPNISIDVDLFNFLMSVGTEKASTRSTRTIGKLNRPRLCIIWALILFASLSGIAGILLLARGNQDLAFKQWANACSTAMKENVENPLFSEELEIDILPNSRVHASLQSGSDDIENKEYTHSQREESSELG